MVGCCGNDIGQLQERPSHLLARVAVFRLRGRTEGERVQRAGGSFEMTRRQTQVSARGSQIGMAEEQLDGGQFSAGFEQVGSERVTQCLFILLITGVRLKLVAARARFVESVRWIDLGLGTI